jgi:hypothetical protein
VLVVDQTFAAFASQRDQFPGIRHIRAEPGRSSSVNCAIPTGPI